MIKAILGVGSILSLVSSAVAAPLLADDEAAKSIAIHWLQVVDSGDYENAVEQTAEQIGLKQNWMSYLLGRRKSLGQTKNRQLVEINDHPRVHGARTWWHYKVVRFRTSFERGQPVALEEVVLTRITCCWEVSGYTVADRGGFKETREHAGMYEER